MLQANEEQQKHIKKMLGEDSDLMYALDNGIRVDSYISYDNIAKIVDYLRMSDKKDYLFEECWIAYKRKGIKKKSFEYWKKLSTKDKESVLPHIMAYTSSREIQFQKDFERYLRDKIFTTVVYQGNKMVYDPTQYDNTTYTPQGRSIWYDENTKTYWSDDNLYYGVISDGYTDDNRPDGAEITLNNARGTYKWNSKNKKWEKK